MRSIPLLANDSKNDEPPSFYTYYTLNGQTLLGPDLDNTRHYRVESETWESYMHSRSEEQPFQGFLEPASYTIPQATSYFEIM